MGKFSFPLPVFKDAGEHERLAPLTVDQYHAMIGKGILPEGVPIELLDGLLVLKDRSGKGADPMTVGPRHVLAIKKLESLDRLCRRHGVHMRCQSPILIPPLHEPEPDAAIVRGTEDDFADRHPKPPEIRCVIEVADSSVMADRKTKQRIYAEAGIPQFVIVNLADEQVEVFRAPDRRRGFYSQSSIHKHGTRVGLEVGKGRKISVAVSHLLP